MTRIQRMAFPLLAPVLLLAACGDSGMAAADDEADPVTTVTVATTVTAATTVTTTATTSEPTVAATPLRLKFDGKGCTYDGPEEFAAGPVTLSYTNLSDENAWIAVNRHTGDETIQDAIDHFGDAPSSTPCPSWKRDVVRTSVEPGDTFSWEGELEPATYHMVCYRYPPLSVWFATGLTVEG
jgi:hypothetical protein